MAGEEARTTRTDSLVIWLLAVVGVAFLVAASDVLSADVSVFAVAALLALGGLLLMFVERFLAYFGGDSGRLFG